MLKEAIEVIRMLWEGGQQNYSGHYYTVEDAQLFTLPDRLPPIYVAASGSNSAELAGEFGDGLICTSADTELVQAFEAAGGKDEPCFGKVIFCWTENEAEARRTAHEIWPLAGLPGAIFAELAQPYYFEQAAKMVTEEQVAEEVPCGSDPEPILAAVQKYAEAGIEHVSLHQIGPDQAGFCGFYARELSPRLQKEYQA